MPSQEKVLYYQQLQQIKKYSFEEIPIHLLSMIWSVSYHVLYLL